MELTQRIRELTALPGVSGQEDAVREYLLRALQGREDCDCRVDALGNLIVKKTGRQTPAKSLLITAHMDEVGYLITYIEDSGLLRFAPVGGVSPEVMAGKRVYVGQKLLPGLVGLKAVHQQKAAERTAPPEADNLYIDIGARSREEAQAAVTLGDRVSFAQNYARFGEGFVRAKSGLCLPAGTAPLGERVQLHRRFHRPGGERLYRSQGGSGFGSAGHRPDPRDYHGVRSPGQ